nr:endonuclease/exonuclease/phosphatase family protein [uncultured Friedmanniella sp.]
MSVPPRVGERPVRAPAWDTTEPGRPGQSALVTVGVLLLVPALVLTLLRVFPPLDDAPALVAAFVPAAVPLLVVGLVCLATALLRARRRAALGGLVALVALLLGAQLAWQLPFYVANGRQVTEPAFTLLTLNTLQGRADPDQLRAAAERADVVVLVETLPAVVAELDRRGWRDRFPHDAGRLSTTVTNTIVFSRYPLRDSQRFGTSQFHQWATTVVVPGIGDIRLLAVHPCNPYCGQNRWASDHAELRRVVQQHRSLPLVVAGDLNAVPDHGPMQDLRRLGLRSAADLVGAGWAPTYPANRLVPPLLTIDHVLLDDRLAAGSLERVRVTGTDHLGVLVRLGRAG